MTIEPSTVTLANGKSFAVATGSTLLEAAQRAGLALPNSCRSGRCGQCRTKVVRGRARHLSGDDTLSAAERAAGWSLTCSDTTDAELSLDVDDLAEFSSLRVLTLPARVHATQRPTPDVLQLTLRLPPGHGLHWLPGQHLELIGANGVRRAYSIANALPSTANTDCTAQPRDPNRLQLLVRRVPGGAMSGQLFDTLQPNDMLRLRGPYGTFALGEVAGLRLHWLATGTGIAPFLAMIDALSTQPRAQWPQSIELYWGNRLPQDHFWSPSECAKSLPLRVTPVCSRADPTTGWDGARGHVQTHALAAAATNGMPDRVYACGTPAMVDASRTAYLQWGLSPRHFHADAFVTSGSP